MNIFERKTLEALDELIKSGTRPQSDLQNRKEAIIDMASVFTPKVCQENQETLKAIGNAYLKEAKNMMESAIENGLAIKEKTGETQVKEHMRAQFQITWNDKILQS